MIRKNIRVNYCRKLWEWLIRQIALWTGLQLAAKAISQLISVINWQYMDLAKILSS